MTDNLVQLLPDSIANQIAAGEVIQRPASVVKELMENAIDAGADSLQLILKDSGKLLIQVVDDGCGMSETDARMSLERHATSKLRHADDLNSLATMGFRGEALASIAAVAHLEIKTRRRTDELGTKIVVEGSEVKIQAPEAVSPGTSMAVRNLFFNVPARRNFLKSDAVELRHIKEEFTRLALAHPDIKFQLFHNDEEETHLPSGNLRQRIVKIFGNKYNNFLIPIAEDTEAVAITGFVGKPEAAKKSRSEQFFFVNQRYIKSAYLHHAVLSAYDDLLPKEQIPFYVIYLEIDPARIDVNVHPTKQEIKFLDEKMIYNYLRATIRHGLGRASIMPTLDFDSDNFFAPGRTQMGRSSSMDVSNPLPSRMNQDSGASSNRASSGSSSNDEAGRHARNLRNWEQLYSGLGQQEDKEEASSFQTQTESVFTFSSSGNDSPSEEVLESRIGQDAKSLAAAPKLEAAQRQPYQLHLRYIVSPLKSGFLLIDQQTAHERILYEDNLKYLRQGRSLSQQSLFPVTIDFPPADAELVGAILVDLRSLGFEMEAFGGNTYIIHGVPAELAGQQPEQQLIENLLEQYKQNIDLQLDGHESLARAMARGAAVKRGQVLDISEMRSLIDRLFACEQPQTGPNGKRCFITFELDELNRRFDM